MLKIKVTGKFPGAFVLGSIDETDGTFLIEHRGCSDKNLKQTLQDHIPDGYQLFAFEYFLSPKGAFEKECEIYHDQPVLTPHPDRIEGSYWKCPRGTALD